MGAMMDVTIGNDVMVLHTAENGTPITDMFSYASRGAQTTTVQKYGRLYSLQIVRWLAAIMYELTMKGAYQNRLEELMGLREPFTMFLDEDSTLRDTRKWSAYPR